MCLCLCACWGGGTDLCSSAAKITLELLLRASQQDGASDVLKQLAELEALPCDNDSQLAVIEEAGAQLPCVMLTHVASPERP